MNATASRHRSNPLLVPKLLVPKLLVPKLLFGNARLRNSRFGPCDAMSPSPKQEFRGGTFPNRSLGTREAAIVRRRSWWRFALFLLAAGLLIFAHGCHGDEDNELFTSAVSRATR
jgi:hypothetical protein